MVSTGLGAASLFWVMIEGLAGEGSLLWGTLLIVGIVSIPALVYGLFRELRKR